MAEAQVLQWSAPHADLCPMSPDKLLEPYKYAVLQKLDDPNEICAHEPIPRPTTLKTSRYVCEVAQNSGSEHGWHGGGGCKGLCYPHFQLPKLWVCMIQEVTSPI